MRVLRRCLRRRSRALLAPSSRRRSPSLPPARHVQVVHSLKAGVVEPAMSKVKSLKFATEAAITILRIDDFIKISPPQAQQ